MKQFVRVLRSKDRGEENEYMCLGLIHHLLTMLNYSRVSTRKKL